MAPKAITPELNITKGQLYKPGNKKSYKLDIVWFNVIGFAVMHAAALYGVFLLLTGHVSIPHFLNVFIAMYFSVFGTTMGAHRLFTHKCYKANKAVRAILLVGFTMAGQNCLWVWVRDHRQHHKYSDTDGDPHNASRGFFFSHIGWLMVRKQPEVIALGKLIDMSDLDADPMVMFQKRYYKTVFIIFSMIVPMLFPYFVLKETLWMAFLISFVTRITITLNGTWLVNSATHIYGNRPFTKDMLPTENEFVSFIGTGEGWHNYHHTFPWDYKAAELGRHYNGAALAIEFCARQGWAWDLKSASRAMVKYRATKRGDGTHAQYGWDLSDKNNNEHKTEEEDYETLKKEAEAEYIGDDNDIKEDIKEVFKCH
uniref:Acyl-CoA desaturase n=1 Tax=Cacopsylla melanoneura TaxID=428564 RepID=A0A8D9B5L4_9HEMI